MSLLVLVNLKNSIYSYISGISEIDSNLNFITLNRRYETLRIGISMASFDIPSLSAQELKAGARRMPCFSRFHS